MTSSDYAPLDVRCNYQDNTTSGLRCRIANLHWSQHASSETRDDICSECKIGSSFRETGCIHLGGWTMIRVYSADQYPDDVPVLESSTMYCQHLKSATDVEKCRACPVTGRIVSQEALANTRSLLERLGFGEAGRQLRQAQAALHTGQPEECMSKAKAALESELRAVLVKLGTPARDNLDMPGLWKAVRQQRHLWDAPGGRHAQQLSTGLMGVVHGVAGLRNELGSDHGRMLPPTVQQSHAELALYSSAALCHFLIIGDANRFRDSVKLEAAKRRNGGHDRTPSGPDARSRCAEIPRALRARVCSSQFAVRRGQYRTPRSWGNSGEGNSGDAIKNY
jgi:hypothetical protein